MMVEENLVWGKGEEEGKERERCQGGYRVGALSNEITMKS